MNKTYRNIWNTATGTWTAVAETARSRSKGSARAARQTVVALALGSASIGGAFAADACTTEDGKGGSLDAAGVCKVTAPRTIGTDAIGTTATLTDDYIKVNSTGPVAVASGANAVAMGQSVTSSGSSSVAIGSGTSADGLHSMALGASSRVVGNSNLAVGDGATVSTLTAPPTNAIAIGTRANVSDAGVTGATGSIAIGNSASAGGTGSIVIGTSTRHSGSGATVVGANASAMGGGSGVAIGNSSAAAGAGSVATGPNATATGTGSVAIGSQAATTNNNSVAIGNTASGSAINTTVIGSNARATGDNATVLGQSGAASGLGAVGIGFRANAQGDRSVALGMDSVADRDNTVSVGSATQQRQVVNVAAGTQATDAVNVSQLQPVVTALGGGATINPTTGAVTGPTYTLANGGTQTTVGGALGALDGALTTANGNIARNTGDITTINTRLDGLSNGTVGLVQQTGAGANITVGASTDGAAVDFTGTAGARKLTGVEAGAVTATSKDAVNGSQLHGVSSSVASAIGGGSTVNADGSISAPSFTLGDGSGGTTTVTSVGGAITNLDGRVTTNEGNIARNTGDIADLASQIGSGTVGLVQQAGAGANITVGANTDGAAVDFTGTAGARKLTGVDAGAVTAASKDAVNGSQLHGVSDSVASAIGGGSTVNADGSISAPSFTVGDGSGGTTTVHSVGDAVTNLDGRVTVNEGAVASLADQIGNGTVGLVQQAGPGANITVGANTDGAAVSFIGTAGARKLSGVANGVNDDDAVTIAQLKATGLIDYTGKEIAAVTYDDISLGSVTFGGTGGTKLLNVAPGLIAAGSMEAVNGGQLHDLQERFAQEYARLDGRVGNLESGGGSGGGGGGGGSDGNVGRGTGGDGSLVVGDGSVASGENSTAVGQGAVASGDNGSAFGQGSAASGSNSSAIGQGSVASGSDSTAIGQGSKATGNGSVAIGAGSVADRDNSVSVGSAGHERQITNVADGTAPTDAVNVRQMDQRFGETNRMINDVAKNAYAGVAAAMAMPNLTPSQPGKTVVAAGAANYKSGSAIAAGATYRTRDGKWLMNGAVSVTSTGDAGVRAQVGYEF